MASTFGRDLPLSRAKLKAFSSSHRSLSSASSLFRLDSRAASPESLTPFRAPSRLASLGDSPRGKSTPTPTNEQTVKSKAQVISEFVWGEKVQSTGRRPMTRDISYRRDAPFGKSLSAGQRELAEALGIEPPKLELFPLPTDIRKLEEMFIEKQNSAGKKLQTFEPSPEQLDGGLDPPMEDFQHQRFIEEVDQVKRKASQYHISKDKEAVKEGGLLFQTKSGLLKESVNTNAPTRFRRMKPAQSTVDFSKPVHINDGKPSGKQEIELLSGWLDYMTLVYINQGTYDSVHQKTRAAQLIYTMCFRELIRQVSVHCAQRGLLMDRIWNSSVEIFTKSEFAFVKQLDELKRKFREVVAKSLHHYEEKLNVVTKKYANLNAELRKEAKRAEDKETENEELKLALSRERKRLKDMQDAIKTLANASVASKVEEERKRLAEEYAKLRIKPQIARRTVSTSTTEDEYMLLESLEVSSVPTLSLKKVAPKTVVLQGHYDDKGRFHKTHELKTDAKGNVEIMEFSDALVTSLPAYHKETNTEEDLGWTFFDQHQMETLAKRSFNISEEEIGKGLWVSDYRELLAERRHREMNLVCAMKSLWVIRHPALTGTKSRGTQLFGHEVREDMKDSSRSESSNSSFELPPPPARRDSVEVEYKVRSLEDFLGKTDPGKAVVPVSVGRVGLELIKTVEAAESQETVSMPLSVLSAMGKMMVSSAFGVKTAEEPIVEEDEDPSEPSVEPVSLADNEAQTDVIPPPPHADADCQTDAPPEPPIEPEEPQPVVEPIQNLAKKRVTWQPAPNLISKIQLKRSHPGTKVLLELIQSRSESEATPDIRAAMHVKTLLKTIHYFYVDRLANIRETPGAKRSPLVESLYDTLLAKHGLRSLAEKKLRDLLTTSIVSAEKSPRVSMFLDFAGVHDRYSTEDWNCYISLWDTLSRCQVGQSIVFDETATENFVSLERAEFVFRSFAEGKLSQRKIDEGLKGVHKLVAVSDGRMLAERVGVDSLLALLLDVYQDTKRKALAMLRTQKSLTDQITLKEAEDLVTSHYRWREHLSVVQKELFHYIDPSDSDKSLRLETIICAFIDLGVFREPDQA